MWNLLLFFLFNSLSNRRIGIVSTKKFNKIPLITRIILISILPTLCILSALCISTLLILSTYSIIWILLFLPSFIFNLFSNRLIWIICTKEFIQIFLIIRVILYWWIIIWWLILRLQIGLLLILRLISLLLILILWLIGLLSLLFYFSCNRFIRVISPKKLIQVLLIIWIVL